MTGKVDLKRTLPSYRARSGRFDVVEVPDLQHLAIDGHGDPNTSHQYADALAALYPLAYAVKFASKQDLGRDYVVMPLEGLWWADDVTAFTSARDKSRWSWTLLVLVPEWIDEQLVDGARARVAARHRPTRLDDVGLRRLQEGRSVQTLHVGPYDDEAAVLERMHHEFIPQNGLRLSGIHHEIYLSDPRRTAPEKLRTILRQPVAPAAAGPQSRASTRTGSSTQSAR